MSDITHDRDEILPDIPADGFHPPRWMVLTAGLVILAGAVSSAALALVGVLEPQSGVSSGTGIATDSVKGAIPQAVPMGSFVVSDRTAEPAAPKAKVAEKAEPAEVMDPAAAVDPAAVIAPPADAPADKPGDAAAPLPKELPF